jgi:hypothetical protein
LAKRRVSLLTTVHTVPSASRRAHMRSFPLACPLVFAWTETMSVYHSPVVTVQPVPSVLPYRIPPDGVPVMSQP